MGVTKSLGKETLTEAIQKAVAGDAQRAAKISDLYASIPSLRHKILQKVLIEEKKLL